MISFGAAGAVVYSTVGGTSVAPAYPTGITAGQMLVLIVGQKPSTANSGTVTTPAGWTLAGSVLAKGGYGATLAATTGNTNLRYYTKVADGSETGTLAVTLATNDVSWAQTSRWTTTSTGWDTTALVSNEYTTASTGVITMTASSAMDVAGQDILLVVFVTASAGGGSFFSSHTITTGLPVTGVAEISEPTTTVGNDIGGLVVYGRVSNGTATATVTWEGTMTGASTNLRGPVGFLRLRENPVVSPTSVNRVTATELSVAEPITAPPGQRLTAVELHVAELYVSADTLTLDSLEVHVASTDTVTQYLDDFEVHVASSETVTQYLDALEIHVASSVAGLPVVGETDLWMWNGTAEVPANVTVWNGTTEIAASVSVT